MDLDEMAELRGRIFALRELAEVNLDDVRKVYGLEALTPPPSAVKFKMPLGVL